MNTLPPFEEIPSNSTLDELIAHFDAFMREQAAQRAGSGSPPPADRAASKTNDERIADLERKVRHLGNALLSLLDAMGTLMLSQDAATRDKLRASLTTSIDALGEATEGGAWLNDRVPATTE